MSSPTTLVGGGVVRKPITVESTQSEDSDDDFPTPQCGRDSSLLIVKAHPEPAAAAAPRTTRGGRATYYGTGGAGEEYLPTGSGEGNIFAYVRRSAEDRSQRPLAAQIDIIDRYVTDCMGGTVRAYFGDNGVSGSTSIDKRDGMSAMFRELNVFSKTAGGRESNGSSSSSVHVVVYDASRLARSVLIGSQVKNALERIGATLHLAQNRMVVEGANADLFFGLNLQLAASERTATISRVRASLRNRPEWDPRKSFGWRFDGAGTSPIAIPEEQSILERMREMYEVQGMRVADIAKKIQIETGPRRCRKSDTTITRCNWTSCEISFLARKHKWVWGGGPSLADLEAELDAEAAAARASPTARRRTVNEVFAAKRGMYYDGAKINRATLRRIMADGIPEWKMRAIFIARGLLRQEKFSNDDIVDMLNDQAPRPGVSSEDPPRGWPRQTGWRIIQDAQRLNERAAARGSPLRGGEPRGARR